MTEVETDSRRDAVSRQQKTQDLVSEAEEKLASASMENWEAFLRTVARFHQYSWRNLALIFFQKPDASFVAGIKKWNSLGRNVKKGEHGIKILAPVHYSRAAKAPQDEDARLEKVREEVVAFRWVTVFDVSQTEGDPLPGIPELHAFGDPVFAQRVVDALVATATDWGISVTLGGQTGDDNTYGYFDIRDCKIVVKPGLTPQQQVSVLAHELGHSLLEHTPDRYLRHRGVCEVEAESTSYVVASYFGFDTSHWFTDYSLRWTNGDRKLAAETAKHCSEAASTIINAVEARLSDDKEEKNHE